MSVNDEIAKITTLSKELDKYTDILIKVSEARKVHERRGHGAFDNQDVLQMEQFALNEVAKLLKNKVIQKSVNFHLNALKSMDE